MKVFVVDDSKTIRNIMRTILCADGLTTMQEAGDGQEAFDKVWAFSPDLILLDWNMPVKDGLTFAKEYRALNKQTPIIMVTTEAEKARVIEAIKAGVNNYVIKPFTPETLRQRIQETLTRKAA